MRIYGAHTIAEYKSAQKKLIQTWIDEHFISGSVTWSMPDTSHVTIVDKSGDSMTLHVDQINGHYVAD